MNDPDEAEARALDALGERFLQALAWKEANQIDRAEDELRAILRAEPRLPEPRLELARVLLDTDRLEEALDHAREALEALENTGPWTEALEEHVVLSIAHATLAEILRRTADEDDVVFGDPAAFAAMLEEARRHFAKAAELDPSDSTASYYAFHMTDHRPDGGLPGSPPRPALPEESDDGDDEPDA